ncbi:hypothetical protein ACWEKT_40640 [Nocardia takedensis]
MRVVGGLRSVALVVVVGVLCVLGGCYRPDGPDEKVRFRHLIAMDPCGFVTGEQVGNGVSFGPSELHGCRYSLSAPGGRDAVITVSVRIESDAAAVAPSGPAAISQQVGSLVRSAGWYPDRGVWHEVIHDVDHNGVAIETYGGGTDFDYVTSVLSEGVDLRSVGTRVADVIVGEVLAGRGVRLSYPEDSLGESQPCGEVSPEQVTAVLGRTAEIEHVSLGSRCEWRTGPVGQESWLRVETELSTEADVAAAGYRDRSAGMVAGRPTVIRSGPTWDRTAAECTYSTSGKTWDRWPGATNRDTSIEPYRLVEVLKVQVRHFGVAETEPAQECAGAELVAETLWRVIR